MKIRKRITNPDKLNDELQATNAITWISLGLIILAIIGIVIWSFTMTLTYKIEGKASINNNVATIEVKENRINEIKVGQKVYINDFVGEVVSVDDGIIKVSEFDLEDGDYNYKIIIKEMHPIEYLFKK